MENTAAKQRDRVTATANHRMWAFAPPVQKALPHPCARMIDGALSADMEIMGLPAPTLNSTSAATLPHRPTPHERLFADSPSNQTTIVLRSFQVLICVMHGARNQNVTQTCDGPADLPADKIVAAETMLGG